LPYCAAWTDANDTAAAITSAPPKWIDRYVISISCR
jgi:hypothetical protein